MSNSNSLKKSGKKGKDLRMIVLGKANIISKLAGRDYSREVRSAPVWKLKVLDKDLDTKINKILNYEDHGDDLLVQAALAKHGALSIAKLTRS